MKRDILFVFVLTALALASCQKEGVSDGPEDPITVEGDKVTITAGFESQLNTGTKTFVSGGSKIYWSSGDDALYVFDSKGGKNRFTSDDTATGPTRTFTGQITSGSEVLYVLWSGKTKAQTDNSTLTRSTRGFDHQDVTEGNGGAVVEWDWTKGVPLSRDVISGSTLKVVNPQNIDAENSFASNANIAIMKKGDPVLRSVFGFIRFTVPKGADGNAAIKSVSFEANENMAGEIGIDYTDDEPVAAIIANGSRNLTVNMRWNGSTSRYEDGTFYAVLPPGTYTNLKIRVTPFAAGASTQGAATGATFELSSRKPVVIQRGKYSDCGVLPATAPGTASVFGTVVQVIPAGTGVTGLCIDSENHVLYAGQSGQMNVYDISSPLSPVLVGSVPVLGNIRQTTLYNGKLYITARETGTWIFDVSSPLEPSFIRRYDSVELATGLDVAGNCMFIGQRQNGVEFVDVTTPSAPRHIRLIDTDESQSVFYKDGYLYSGEWSGKITVFDAHDLSNIQKLKTVNLQGQGDGLWVSGNRLYASTGHHHRNETPSTVDGDGHGVEIFDITDPANPVFISRTEFDIFYKSGADWWLVRPSGDGKTLFCGDVYNGLYVVDITDETAPVIVERYTLSDDSAVNSVALGPGVVYMATSKDGLLAMSCSRALPSPRDRGTLPSNASARYDYTTSSSRFVAWKPATRGAVHSVAAWGDALFVGCGDAGLSVVKVTRNGGTVTATTYSTLDIPYAGGVAVRGNRLYVSRGETGIGVYKITDGPVLTPIATIKDELSSESRKRYSCWLSAPNDNYVVNGVRYAGFQFLAVGGTDNAPTFTYRGEKSKNVNYNKYISEGVCADDRLPYATRDGLFWIDLSSKSSAPVSDIISGIKSSIPCGVTEFSGGSALITDNKGHLFRVESGATSVAQTATVSTDIVGIPRWDGNNTVMLTYLLGRSITKLDLSDFTSPSVLYTESGLSGNPEPGIFVDGKALIPCGYQGLLIEK